MEIIPYGKQYIDQDDIDAVIEVLNSDWLTQGPKVKEFEDNVARYHHCKYAVAFCNGTAALHASYYVSTKFPFGKGDKRIEDLNIFTSYRNPSEKEYLSFKKQYWEFITTPITFVATANAGLYCGGSQKFVDIDLKTYCIDIEKIEDEITDLTRVITAVSYAGYPVDIKAIKSLPKVKNNNICIIHDACHAIGARRNGQGIVDFADMTVLSFHPVKHITTGEGGMVITNNKEYYDKLILFRNHGITKNQKLFVNKADGGWYYEMQELGYNYRLTDIQSALGISQMKKLDLFLYRRNQIAQIYQNELQIFQWMELPPTFNKDWLEKNEYKDLIIKPKNLHAYHLFPIKLDARVDKKNFFNYMYDNGIGVQVHYIPIHLQPSYSKYYNQFSKAHYENSKLFYESEISLPMYFNLENSKVQKVKIGRAHV